MVGEVIYDPLQLLPTSQNPSRALRSSRGRRTHTVPTTAMILHRTIRNQFRMISERLSSLWKSFRLKDRGRMMQMLKAIAEPKSAFQAREG